MKWSSSASGTTREKKGVVVCVVSAGAAGHIVHDDGTTKRPFKNRDEWRAWLFKTNSTFFGGFNYPVNRDHESYIVRVAGKTEKSKAKLYQPRVSALQVVRDT